MTISPVASIDLSPRELVAAEVRAELARRKGLNSNTLPNYIGKSQRYWNERLNARLAFDSDDIAKLSWLLQVPMSRFVPDVIAEIEPDAPAGPAAVIGGGTRLYGVGTGIHRMIGEPRLPTVKSSQSGEVIPLRPTGS